MRCAALLLAGGVGRRFGSSKPKQFLPLGEKCVAKHSFDLLQSRSEITSIVVVATPLYHPLFQSTKPLSFAMPGKERQDSVWNGLHEVEKECEWICVHDAARPFINSAALDRLFKEGMTKGAATLALPLKFTIKEGLESIVVRTPDRTHLWEIQTPQLIRSDWLYEGLERAQREKLILTDDVAAAELLGHPVQLVLGDENNLKITTPRDYQVAQWHWSHVCSSNV